MTALRRATWNVVGPNWVDGGSSEIQSEHPGTRRSRRITTLPTPANAEPLPRVAARECLFPESSYHSSTFSEQPVRLDSCNTTPCDATPCREACGRLPRLS